jgi:predicted amidohydrolase
MQDKKTFKAVVCQIDCVHMKKEENITRFDARHLSGLSRGDKVDIILFP